MRRNRAVSTLLAIGGAVALVVPIAPGIAEAQPIQATTICVGQHRKGCAQTIQQAVNSAPAGATIDVAPGTYAEQVTINKSLTLQVPNGKAVIDATGRQHGIFVSGAATAGTVISGFTVENALLEGILVQATSHVTVSGNTVQKNDQGWVAPATPGAMATCPGALPFDQDDCGEGVHLNGVTDSVVADNVVQNNVGGILLTDEAGANHDNLITRNLVKDNRRDCGITLPSHPSGFGPSGPLPGNGVFHNTISDNVSTGNGGAGVGMFTPTPGTASHDNLVIGNTLTDNGLPGVALHSHAPGQNLNGNRIIGNTIANNGADDDAGTSGPTGIIVFSDGAHGAAPITGTEITNNTIDREAIDVWVGTAAISQVLRSNNLLGSHAVGVQNAGTGTVDATNNYWGCPGGPGAPGCSSVTGTVLFTPWLTRPVSRS